MKHISVIAFLLCSLLGLLFCVPKVEAQTGTSPLVFYECTSAPCPWGEPSEYHVAWPDGGTNQKLGYTLSHTIYLPAVTAVGVRIEITSGQATIYKNRLDESDADNVIATLNSGDSYTIQVSDAVEPEYIHVHSFFIFSYVIYPNTIPDPGGDNITPYIIPALTPNQTPLDILPTYSVSITNVASGSGLSILALLFLFLSFRLIYWVTHR